GPQQRPYWFGQRAISRHGRPAVTGTLRQFAAVADAIAATSGKLEKTRLLAEFFRALPDEGPYWAAVSSTGAAFPRTAGKVVQVGFAALQAAALAVTGAPPERFAEEYLRWSDVGDTVGVLFKESCSCSCSSSSSTPDELPSTATGTTTRTMENDLSLADLAASFDRIAATPAGTAKTAVVTELFRRLGPEESRYLAKILTGDRRSGRREGRVEEAIAAAFGGRPAGVRKAHQLAGDIGKVAAGARAGHLANLQVALFTPLKPMLATAESSPAVI